MTDRRWLKKKQIKLRGPSELLSALPAMLGFIPRQSLVVVIAEEPLIHLGPVIRIDLPIKESAIDYEEYAIFLGSIHRICLAKKSFQFFVILIDGEGNQQAEIHRELLAQFDATTSVAGGLTCAWLVAEITEGATWTQVWPQDECDSGIVTEPMTTELALVKSLQGNIIRSSRMELTGLFSELPHCDTAGCSRSGKNSNINDIVLEADSVEEARLVDSVVSIVVMSRVRPQLLSRLSCVELADCERALLTTRARDSLVSLAATEYRHQARELYLLLTKKTRGKGRSAAAAMYAHTCYTAGDGALAGVALQIAIAENSTNHFARLLNSALEAGLSPDAIAELAKSGYVTARQLGVVLPPQISWVVS